MNFATMLDELRNNILNDRGTSTGDDDKLWSNTTLKRYINEGVRRFAVRTYAIRDSSTPAVVEVSLLEGVADYELHPSVISVLSARVMGTNTDLSRVGHSIVPTREAISDVAYYASVFSDTTTQGAPLAYATDEAISADIDGSYSVVTLHVYPVPRAEDEGTVIKLRVARAPLADMTADDDIPEIPLDYHLDVLDWAAYLALRILDEDAGNAARAQGFAASFEAHVQDAKKLVLRKLGSPQTWGFGRGGFVWGA